MGKVIALFHIRVSNYQISLNNNKLDGNTDRHLVRLNFTKMHSAIYVHIPSKYSDIDIPNVTENSQKSLHILLINQPTVIFIAK